ncbi:MAG: hypothetical protein BWY75_03473 [bacterium ADurb.Bin425]|nr:MAG: hypothetical protein BWY75_03473 [bacterium ADurb.Bin425]
MVPGWELSKMGKRTMTLPSKIVKMACQAFMPEAIRPEDIIYVGMQADMENQRAT